MISPLFGSITVRLPFELVQELDADVEMRKFRNRSEALRSYVILGKKAYSYKAIMDDPIKQKQFQDEMNQILKGERITEWISTLSGTQLEGIMQGIQLEKEQRIKNPSKI